MEAEVCAIIGRTKPEAGNPDKLSHFTLGAARREPAERLVQEPGWSIYSLDHDKRQAIFVRLPPEADIADAAFAHEKQFEDAHELALVPFAALEALSRAAPQPKRTIHIFSIGRCGTTLANWLFNRVEGVWSLSEPDVYFDLAMKRASLDPKEVEDLVAATTRLLFRPPAGKAVHTLGVKHRSQSLFQADLFYRAFPEAKYVFMYRDAESWGNSLHQFAQRLGLPAVLDEKWAAFQWWIMSGATDPAYVRDLFDIRTAQDDQLTAAGWAAHIEEYLRLFQAGVPFLAVRYNELDSHREREVRRLLAHCGLPSGDVTGALAAFDRDSQEGTDIARDRKAVKFGPENYARFRATLARHPRIRSGDIILPDIEHPYRQV